jgi:hypothetical protein
LAERGEFELSGNLVNGQRPFHDVKQSVPMVRILFAPPTSLRCEALSGDHRTKHACGVDTPALRRNAGGEMYVGSC